MRLDDYPTPAQTSIYIGDQWIDDATRVQFEIQHPRIPLYGYNRGEFGAVADGKILITGNLVINYRLPGYLLQAIENARANDTVRNVDTALRIHQGEGGDTPRLTRPKLYELLKELKRDTDSTKRLSRLGRAMRDGTFREVSALMRQVMTSRFRDVDDRWFTQRNNPALGKASDVAFDIQVAYGDNYGPMKVDVLRECYITGMGKAMSASAGGGGFSASGMPIYEVYPFIARTIDQFLVEVEKDPAYDGLRTGPYAKTVKPQKGMTVADVLAKVEGA
jgi:hypothetical protein